MPSRLSETDLQRGIIDLAKLLGLLVHHDRPVKHPDGTWRVAIEGHAGFPDLVIVGPRGVLFRELKTEQGRIETAQGAWIGMLTRAQANVAVWRPSDWPERVRRELEAIR